MDVSTIHRTALFSLEKILAKHHLKDFQLNRFDKWAEIQRKLESIRTCSDYFLALRLADEVVDEFTKFIKAKKMSIYGKLPGG